MFLDGLKIKRFGGRVDRGLKFDSRQGTQSKLNRLIASHSRGIDTRSISTNPTYHSLKAMNLLPEGLLVRRTGLLAKQIFVTTDRVAQAKFAFQIPQPFPPRSLKRGPSEISQASKSFTTYEDLSGRPIHPVPIAPRRSQSRPPAWAGFEALRKLEAFPCGLRCG